MGQTKAFESTKFVSFVALERHRKYVVKKISILERGLQVTLGSRLILPIENRRLPKLVEHSKLVVIPTVREFYANAYEHQDYKVFVKGKRVPFDRTKIKGTISYLILRMINIIALWRMMTIGIKF